MPAAPVPPIVASSSTGWTGGRIAMVISGSVLAMISFALLSGGVATLCGDRRQRDDVGYLTTGRHLYVTAGAALTTSPIELSPPGSAGIVQALLGDIRVNASSPVGEDIFVGIGPSDEVEAYLSGVGVGVMESSTKDTVEESPGGAATPPGEQTFWVTSDSGVGEQTLDWSVADGEWTIVTMNPDGSRGLDAFLSAGATVPALGWITFGLIVIGVISLAAGALLIVVAVRRSGAPQGLPA